MSNTAIHESHSWRRVVVVETVRVMAVAIVLGAVIAAFLPKRVPTAIFWPTLPAGYAPVGWPYLRDQFDPGVAARCLGLECAANVEITIRPKRGFCDCERGVYDDTQLREVGDLALTGSNFTPQGPGQILSAGGLNGRYRLHTAKGEAAVSAALHKGCDVIVIVARARQGAPVSDALLDFLNQKTIADWIGGLLDQKPL